MSRERDKLYEFESFRLDVGEHTLEHAVSRENVSLPEKAFQTLCFLVQNSGHLMTKRELLDLVWPDSFVEENNLDKSIHAIRNALGENVGEQKYIETVRKHGYRFVADVRRIDHVRRSPTLARASEWQSVVERVEERKAPFIAVPNDKFLQEAGDRKADLQGSNGEKRFFRGKSRRSYLAAGALLIGGIGLGGWFVNGGWQVAVMPGSEKLSPENSPANHGRSPAYDLYVRGKVKVGSENREDTEAAIKVLEEAVAIDPNFAEAHAQLARGYNTVAFKYSSGADRKRFHENAEVAIEKALALNPDLAEGHFARGLILWTNTKGFPHEQAIQSYKRSLAFDPNSDETHHQLTLVYSHIGLLDEAEQSINRSLEINPNNTLARFRRGVNIAYQGRFDEAIAIYKTIPRDFTPLLVDRSMAEALIQTGRTEEAERIVEDYLQRFPKDEGGSFNGVKALMLAKGGKQREAEEAIERSIEIGKDFGHFHHTAYNVACAYAAMNMPDEAVRWLENAADNGFPNYSYFEIDPNLDGLRKHQRYMEFMTKLRERWQRYKAIA